MTRLMCPVIFAFPGMGKSTLAKKNHEFGDTDFGAWRKENGIDRLWDKADSPHKEAVYRKFVDEFLLPASARKSVLLTNEPGLAKYIEAPMTVILPSKQMRPLWLRNIIIRTAKSDPLSFDDPNSFISQLRLHYDDWIDGENWRVAHIMYFDDYSDWTYIERAVRRPPTFVDRVLASNELDRQLFRGDQNGQRD